eukprot:821294-Rhodomonas_salina.1
MPLNSKYMNPSALLPLGWEIEELSGVGGRGSSRDGEGFLCEVAPLLPVLCPSLLNQGGQEIGREG